MPHAALGSIIAEPKIDCHVHVLDPARFPYEPGSRYCPSGQELATTAQLFRVMDAYGVRQALLVGPNSGYRRDNRCLLDAIERGGGRLKGVAVVDNDAGLAELAALKAAGIVGVAFNPTFHGVEYYRRTHGLLARLAELDMLLQIQVEGDQLVEMQTLLDRPGPKLLIDHCGRPVPEAGLGQPGWMALLALGRSGRASVKLSGYSKFARLPYPYADAEPFLRALVEAFTLERCLWASDWPFLRAPERIDYGPLLQLAAVWFPDPVQRRTLFWDTPRRLFGFDE